MSTEEHDLVVIGAGPAGQVAAEFAAAFGRRALVVEQNQPGGVVTTTGGAPTKALREAALYLTGFRFATIFTALGIPATLVSQSDRLLPSMDGELAGLMADEFEQRGVRLILGAGTEGVARIDGRLRVTLSTGAVLATDAVLFAAGRPPNTEGLGLAEAGVQLDARVRIVVDRYYRTSAAGISADDRKLLGVHCLGDIASEVVGLGHVVLHVGGTVELFLTLALNTPTYTYAYHDAAIDGLTRLAELMGHDVSTAVPPAVTAAAGG